MSSRGRDFLFMVEDRFNKLGAFIPCKKVIKGHEAVKLFFADSISFHIQAYRNTKVLKKLGSNSCEDIKIRRQRHGMNK